MSLKRACRSARSRTPPELIRVQCESSYDGETGSCGSSQSSESGSSTSSSSESSSSPTESHSQTAYDAAERELILVSYGAGGVPVLYTLTKPKSVACSVHSKLGVGSHLRTLQLRASVEISSLQKSIVSGWGSRMAFAGGDLSFLCLICFSSSDLI